MNMYDDNNMYGIIGVLCWGLKEKLMDGLL